jgi:hypothetical protein
MLSAHSVRASFLISRQLGSATSVEYARRMGLSSSILSRRSINLSATPRPIQNPNLTKPPSQKPEAPKPVMSLMEFMSYSLFALTTVLSSGVLLHWYWDEWNLEKYDSYVLRRLKE